MKPDLCPFVHTHPTLVLQGPGRCWLHFQQGGAWSAHGGEAGPKDRCDRGDEAALYEVGFIGHIAPQMPR